ncbi:S-layer homology domain-containing protein [Salibacterium halotolerans]|uniref:S-layer homology domain-containing protein n=1 Tax=Salibacterium halotolerans TaxID=1884432 RepID=A0A1I5WVV7_9BACI|nr:S-layer homology domain-containing protein [Salibacterium halotolerans]SFQ23819.1 S-layer homology domain-containing protein [Salibacterium halotolerans]
MSIKKYVTRGIVSMVSGMLFFSAAQGAGASSFQVGPGVSYESDDATGADILQVDLTQEYSKLDINVPEPLDQLRTTSQQAKNSTRAGHRVIGAVNASFFDMGSGSTQLPFSIITQNNEIISYGRVSDSRVHYRSEPIVFGEKSNGKAAIGQYDANVSAQVNGSSVTVDNINTQRLDNEAILFTSSYINNRTGTNQYGMEIVVETASGNPGSFSFGDEISGSVTDIRAYNEAGNALIPENGFVLSARGDRYDQLKNVSVGDEITVSASINDKWKDASFIVGSGPQLVRNGELAITMNSDSWRYTSKTERTAVGVDESGDHVYMVTMDRASIRDLAVYMRDIGAERALNFDGGGSSTMVARQHGDGYASVMNSLSGGERRVSSTLQAVSTAPRSPLARLILSREDGVLLTGYQMNVSTVYGMDQYFNPVDTSSADINWNFSSSAGSMDGSTFTAQQAGEGRIQASVDGNQVGSTGVTVTDSFDTWNLSHSELNVDTGESVNLSADPALTDGRKLLFDKSRINWSVQGDVGTIDSSGHFTASGENASGSITVELAGNSFEIPVQVNAPSSFEDVPRDYWAAGSIEYLAGQGIINGYNDGTFRPGGELKRSQAASMMVRAFDLSRGDRPSPEFSDITSDFHAYEDIAAVADEELMRGSGDTFRPNGELTRAQMAVILVRAFDLKNQGNGTSFQDVPDDYWARGAIETLASHGVARGSNGNYRPGEAVTRAQFTVFMERALEDL